MKVIYVSSLMSKKKMNFIINNSAAKPPQSIQRYHRLLCEGLVNNDCKVKTISAIPISRSISSKTMWKAEKEEENGVNYQYLPFINLPFVRQLLLFVFAFLYSIKEIICNDDESIVFICDVLNTSISIGSLLICKIFGVDCVGIVTDLPSDMKQSKKISIFLNNLFLDLYHKYIFLTKYMNDKINHKNKPYQIVEGICDNLDYDGLNTKKSNYIMYAGGLYEKYGLNYLINGFIKAKIPNVKLKLFGTGDLVDKIEEIKNDNIVYGGVLTNDEIIECEKEAMLLVNPRFSNMEYTKYSFPSKNIEYMSSGTPVLTTKLKGIPEEYFNYVYLIDDETEKGIKNKLIEIFSKTKKELKYFGNRAKKFVNDNKNKDVQAKKVREFLLQKHNYNSNSNSKKNNIYGIIVLFLTIILSRNTLISSNILGFYNSQILLILVYIPLIIIYIKQKKYKNISFVFKFLIILLMFSIILKRDFQLYNCTIILYLLLSYIYISLYDRKKVLKWFCLIVVFLSIYSLIGCYVVYPKIINVYGYDAIKNSSLYFCNVAETPFLNLVFSFPVVIIDYVRNFGIFTEPGFFQFYLILTIVLLSKIKFFSKKINILFCVIIALTLISTFSAAGYICLFLFLFLSFVYKFISTLKSGSRNQKTKIFVYSFIVIVLIILLLLYLFNYSTVFNNMFKIIISKLTSMNDSSSTRLYSLVYTLKSFFTNPLLGNNFNAVVDNGIIITNTNITFFAIYGLLCGLILLILLYIFCSKLANNRFILFSIFIVLLLSANNHLFIGVHSFWLILLTGIKEE